MAGGRDWYAPVCSLGAAGQLGSASAWSSRIRASAKAVSALALYTTERCIQSTALRRSLAGGSGACCANPGARDASRKTRVRAVISRPPREPLPVAAIIVLLQSRCALQAVAALGPRGPRRDCESRALSGAQRAQARLQVLVATHDSTAALVDEELDLEVDGGPLVVGAQPEVPAVADDQLTARERVADLRRGAAVDVGAVENRDDTVGGVDRGAIGRAHLAVELPPGFAPLGPVRQPLHGLDLVGIGQGPGIEHLVAETRHERHDHGLVEVPPGFGEAEWTGHVDLRRGRHPPEHSPPRAATATPTKRRAAAWGTNGEMLYHRGAGRSTHTRSADMLTSRSLSAAIAVLVTLAVVGPVAAQEF